MLEDNFLEKLSSRKAEEERYYKKQVIVAVLLRNLRDIDYKVQENNNIKNK